MTARRPLGPTPRRRQKQWSPQSRRLQVRSISVTLRQWLTVRNPLRTSNVLSRFTLPFYFCACVGLIPSSSSSSLWFSCSLSLAFFFLFFFFIMVGAVWWHDKSKDKCIHSHTSAAFCLICGFDTGHCLLQPIRTPLPV